MFIIKKPNQIIVFMLHAYDCLCCLDYEPFNSRVTSKDHVNRTYTHSTL
jgi:hypothetical protein